MPAVTHHNRASAMQGQPEAPKGFDAAARTLWKDIVSSRPASTWTPSDVMLLKLYVGAAMDIERLDRDIDREGDVIGGKINPAVKVRAAREVFLLSLGMKLKLMPSNRWDPKGVHRMAQHAGKARAAAAVMDDDEDDLLSGHPTGAMQ